MKDILFIDLDGVIVDYDNADMSNRGKKHFFMTMLPIKGAIEAVEKLNEHFDIYFATTAPWSNPHSWIEKRLWVEQYFPEISFKKLILTHNKGLLKGKYIIDDRTVNGVSEFEGEHIHFGSERFPNWKSVLKYLNL